MSMFANNALLGGGVWVLISEQRKVKKIKGTTKPLMANLDITLQSLVMKYNRVIHYVLTTTNTADSCLFS